MSRISEINIETAPENIKKIVADHVAEGHTITAEKRTLLHNAAAFNAVEAGSYALDDELARLIGGSMITETTLAGAAELLRLAEQTKKGASHEST